MIESVPGQRVSWTSLFSVTSGGDNSSCLTGVSELEEPVVAAAVRVRAMVGLRCLNQKATSDVSFEASELTLEESLGPLVVDPSLLLRRIGCCGTGFRMVDVSDAEVISSDGWSKLSGRKASPHKRLRTPCF